MSNHLYLLSFHAGHSPKIEKNTMNIRISSKNVDLTAMFSSIINYVQQTKRLNKTTAKE